MTSRQLLMKWSNMLGDDIGAISSSGTKEKVDEIFINLDTRVPKLTNDQIAIIWKYFEYVRKVYPNANMSISEDSLQNNEDSDSDDETGDIISIKLESNHD